MKVLTQQDFKAFGKLVLTDRLREILQDLIEQVKQENSENFKMVGTRPYPSRIYQLIRERFGVLFKSELQSAFKEFKDDHLRDATKKV